MSESERMDRSDIDRTTDRCAGVRACANDLPARGVRVCGCVYTAHHTPLRSTTDGGTRCADADSRTPTTNPDLAARQSAALARLARAAATNPLIRRRTEETR